MDGTLKRALLCSCFVLCDVDLTMCLTNLHPNTVKSTIHRGQGNRQPADDQGAGVEYTYIVMSLAKWCGNTQGGQPPRTQDGQPPVFETLLLTFFV